MSFTTTYSDLVSEIQSIMEDDGTEFVAELPNIVNQSEMRVCRDLDLEIFKTSESITLDAVTVDKPSGAIRIDSIFDEDNDVMLQRRSPDYVRLYGGTGTPLYFAEEGDDATDGIRLAPAPSSSISATARVLKRPTALVLTTNETNWLTDNVGDLLLAAGLVYAARFLKMSERAGELEAGYQVLLAQTKAETLPQAGVNPTPQMMGA